MFSIFAHNDCNRCGQTSRPVTGIEIQTSCYLKACSRHCHLTLVHRIWRRYYGVVQLQNCVILWFLSCFTEYYSLNFLLPQNLPKTPATSGASTRKYSPKTSNRPEPLNIARYRKTVSSAVWIQLSLIAFYLPGIVIITLVASRGLDPILLLVCICITTFIHFNSSLKPVLYCWTMREVRQVTKDILRQTFRF